MKIKKILGLMLLSLGLTLSACQNSESSNSPNANKIGNFAFNGVPSSINIGEEMNTVQLTATSSDQNFNITPTIKSSNLESLTVDSSLCKNLTNANPTCNIKIKGNKADAEIYLTAQAPGFNDKESAKITVNKPAALTSFIVGDNMTVLGSNNHGLSWSIKSGTLGISLNSVTYDGKGQYVAVGNNGTIIISTDGDTWIPVDSGITEDLSSISYGNGKYVAVGPNGKIVSSTNGSVWEQADSGTSNSLSSVIYGNERFIAVGARGTIISSKDGKTWSSIDSKSSSSFHSVIYGNRTYVAIAIDGSIIISKDGDSWKAVTSGTTKTLLSVIYDKKGQFLAVGYNGIVIISTDDGETWNPATTPPTPSERNNMISVASDGNGNYLAVEEGGAIAISSDYGKTWTSAKTNTYRNLNSVIYVNGKYLAVGGEGTIISSADKTTWIPAKSGTQDSLKSIVYDGKSKYVAVGSGGKIFNSTNGETWIPTNSGTTSDLWAITYDGKEQYVAVGVDETIMTSKDDGNTWTKVKNLPEYSFFTSVVYDGKVKYTAVGLDGIMLMSLDKGETWTKVDIPSNRRNLYSIAYDGKGHYVVLGDSMLFSSEDEGKTWSTHAINPTTPFVTYGDNKFIVVGGNTIITSIDGKSWKSADSVPHLPGSLTSVAYGSGHYLAVGRYSTIITSTDGDTWTLVKDVSPEQHLAKQNHLNAVLIR